MYNKNNLSKRPFVIITNRYTPGPHAQTHQKGWAEKSGWVINEELAIVDRIKPRHETYATVIIDVMEAKVLRNRLQNAPDDTILTHYMTKYKAQIQQAVGTWMERLSQTKAMTEFEQFAAIDAAPSSDVEDVNVVDSTTEHKE